MNLRSPAVIGVLAIGITACAAQSTAESPTQLAASTFAPGVTTSVHDLTDGECFTSTEDWTAQEVIVTGCSEGHEYEIYYLAAFDAGPSDEYPGTEAITAFVNDTCTEQFDSFVGRPYDDSALWFTGVVPTEDSWATGDRLVRCALYWPDQSGVNQPLTQSMEGSDR